MTSFYELVYNIMATSFPRSAVCTAQTLASLYCRDGQLTFPDFDNDHDAIVFILCNIIHKCGDCDLFGLCNDLDSQCWSTAEAIWNLIKDIKAGNITIDSCFPETMPAPPPSTPTQPSPPPSPSYPSSQPTYPSTAPSTDPTAIVNYMINMMMDVTEMQIMMQFLKDFMSNLNPLGGGNNIEEALKPLMQLIPIMLIIEVI